MKDLARILAVLNTVVIDQLRASVSPAGSAADANLALERLQVRIPEAEGLTFQELRVGIQDLTLPSREDKTVAATVRVDRMVLDIAPEFYARVADFARERLIAKASLLVDRVVLDNLQIRVHVSPTKTIAVEVYLEKVQILKGETLAQQVENVRVRLEDFTPGPDKKAALAASKLYLYNLTVRITETFLNKTTEVVRDRIPPMVEDVSMNLSGGKLAASARVRVGLALTGKAELQFRTQRNNFGIQFLKVTGVPMAGKLLPWVAGFLSKKLPIETSSDTIWINPWKKIPIPVVCKAERFTVENNQIVLEFIPPDEAPPLHLHRTPEATETLPPVTPWAGHAEGFLPPLP